MNDTLATPNYPQPNVYGPITAGQLYERTFTLLREHFKLFFGIVLVAIGVEVVVGAVLGFGGMWTRHAGGGSSVTRMVFMAPIALMGAALIYVFTQIVQGALFFATQSRLAGRPLNVGEACRLAADKAGKIVGVSLLIALRMIGYLLVFYFIFGVMVFVLALVFGGLAHFAQGLRLHAGATPPIGVYAVLALLGTLFFAIYMAYLFWLIARYAASIPACLEENLGVTEAIRRSIQLTAKSKGRIYALLLGAACLSIAIALVTFPVQFIALSMAAREHSMAPAAAGAVALLFAGLRIVIGGVLIALIGVATTLCYYDLRVRKEGFGALPPLNAPIASPAVVQDLSSLPDTGLPL